MSTLPGRRIAARARGAKPGPGTIIAVAAPVITLVALLLQSPADSQRGSGDHAPQALPLAAVDLACPPASGGPVVLASAAEEKGGTLTRRTSASQRRTPVRLAPGRTVTIPEKRAVLVHGEAEAARSVFGARVSTSPPAAAECAPPGGVSWFVGAGSGAAHLSTLSLANPDGGPAVADVSVWSTHGELQEIESRGLTIPGGTVSTLPLVELAPDAREVAVRVIVARGRLTATMQDSFGKVGGSSSADALPATAAPSRSQVIPGLPRTANARALTLVNPGADEVRVTLRLVGARTTFAPSDVPEIRVPAGRVVVTDLTKALKKALASDDAALLVSSTEPVAASLRTTVTKDVVHLPAVPREAGPAAAVVPGTDAQLVLTAGDRGGTVTVTWAGTNNKRVTVRLARSTTQVVDAPKGTRFVTVTGKVPYAGVLRVQSGRGAAALPLRPLVSDFLVPAVRPAWPPQ